MKQWYESLFENYAHKYDKECFVHGTVGECDFIEAEIGRDKSLNIIDIGCGTGRHSIELARRGYSLIGVDLSESQLIRAREKAKKNNADYAVIYDFEDKDNFYVAPYEWILSEREDWGVVYVVTLVEPDGNMIDGRQFLGNGY